MQKQKVPEGRIRDLDLIDDVKFGLIVFGLPILFHILLLNRNFFFVTRKFEKYAVSLADFEEVYALERVDHVLCGVRLKAFDLTFLQRP